MDTAEFEIVKRAEFYLEESWNCPTDRESEITEGDKRPQMKKRKKNVRQLMGVPLDKILLSFCVMNISVRDAVVEKVTKAWEGDFIDKIIFLFQLTALFWIAVSLIILSIGISIMLLSSIFLFFTLQIWVTLLRTPTMLRQWLKEQWEEDDEEEWRI